MDVIDYMIFSVEGHVEQIIAGTKMQTRRDSDRYEVGKTYAVQRCRTCRGIEEGRIKVLSKWIEDRVVYPYAKISPLDALDEGGYTPDEFEALYELMHPDWTDRVAYVFRFVPKSLNGR